MPNLLIIKGVTSNRKTTLNFDYIPFAERQTYKTHIAKSASIKFIWNDVEIEAYANVRAMAICENDKKILRQEIVKYMRSFTAKK